MTEESKPQDSIADARHVKKQLVSKEEIRFVDYWKEQRQGPLIKYYLLYSVSWGLMVTLFSFFIIMFLGGISIIPIAQDNYKIVAIVAAGLATGTGIAFVARHLNEKRYFRILDKVRRNMMN